MKNKFAVLLLLTLSLCACKKESHTQNPLLHPKQLKTKRSGGITYMYFYDSNSRLGRSVTTLNNGAEETETYSYNNNGRMIYSSSPSYTNTYSYDAGNRILQHTRIAPDGTRDSVTFLHRNDTTIGSWREYDYYYVHGRLEYLFVVYHYTFNSFPMSMRIRHSFYYNLTPDLSSLLLLRSYDAVTLADFIYPRLPGAADINAFEMNSCIYVSGNHGQPQLFKYAISRTYDQDNYPLSLIITQENSYPGTVCEYSYY